MKQKDAVIRISRDNYDQLRAIIDSMSESEGKKFTLNQMIQSMLFHLDAIQNAEKVFLAGNKVFLDLAEARGEEIKNSVKSKQKNSVKIAIVIGEDDLC
jgi:hypothetical protein